MSSNIYHLNAGGGGIVQCCRCSAHHSSQQWPLRHDARILQIPKLFSIRHDARVFDLLLSIRHAAVEFVQLFFQLTLLLSRCSSRVFQLFQLLLLHCHDVVRESSLHVSTLRDFRNQSRTGDLRASFSIHRDLREV